MGMLKLIFIILFLFSLGCAVKGMMDKRRNIGFGIVAVMAAIGDVFCFVLFDVQNFKDASNVFLPYYILHAWSLFAFLIMIILIDRKRRYIVSLVLSAVVCVYQTYLVISHYFGARIFSFQKRIYFRKAFWVAVDDNKNTGLFFSYRSYRIGVYINLLIILCVLIICMIQSHKIFRSRYYAFFILAIVYSVVEGIKIHFTTPVWIPCMGYNIISILCLYLTGNYARTRLREWSLDSFANDMSDGLILYDRYDDLIHLNDMVKNTLEAGLLEEFKDKTKLEDWIAGAKDEIGEKIITYNVDDREYYFKVNVIELGGENAHIGTLFILHDTTDSAIRIKVMEKANEELERASRMKSDFLANMSHEIRTPMNAVIGMAEIAMREKDPQQITDYLLQIQSSGKNLLNIINDILDYSKIESGKMEIIEEEYEPFDEYLDIANVVATRIGDKRLELFVIVETELPHKLFGDAMRIRQVLINLANNAVKFTKEGMVRVHITCEPDPNDDTTVYVTYHVVDTGIGIKEEDLNKLFVSFQQVDSKRNRSVEGTGLGLAIAKKLVEAMNGTIGVDSEYGKGSDFWFKIPQKIIDDTNDLAVSDASGKYTFVLDEKGEMSGVFEDEMKHLGVESSAITTIGEYAPSGKKDFLFFKEEWYDDQIKEFLDSHKDVTGVILVDVASEFESDRPNLNVMRKPESTMGMVRMLNNKYSETRKIDENKVFKADFTAPDAKILIVDDNKINLTIATELMAPIKATFDTADGGQEAIDKVMATEYDIVFMDHMMPEIDGCDATRKIREAGDAIHQPVIVALSANVMEEAKRLFEEAGMNDFVAKPVDVRKLLTTVKKWLSPDKIKAKDENELESEEDLEQEEVLINFDGLDIETAVHSLGSASMYNKIAGEYYRSGEDRLNSIREAFDKEDWEDYTIKVHALKSSSRQIGAMELGDKAEALEKAGKAKDLDTIKADTAEALNDFAELLEKMSDCYGEDDSSSADKPLIDKDTLSKLLAELEENCDNLDLDGMESIDNKLKGFAYEEDIREDIESLHKAIADIDTDVCMEIINRVRDTF